MSRQFGWFIVEYEQNGIDRAEYGTQLLSRMAERFRHAGIQGASTTRLKLFRQFYRQRKRIGPTLSDQFQLPAFADANTVTVVDVVHSARETERERYEGG